MEPVCYNMVLLVYKVLPGKSTCDSEIYWRTV